MVKSKFNNYIHDLFNYVNNNITAINNSKLFAGLIIITLNIASKFVTIKLSKTIESYLKFTFSRDILVFSIAWMGTREIYVALIITLIFKICIDYLFNENSALCCLPESFTNYHVSLLDNVEITDEDIQKAQLVLDKAKKQKLDITQNRQSSNKPELNNSNNNTNDIQQNVNKNNYTLF